MRVSASQNLKKGFVSKWGEMFPRKGFYEEHRNKAHAEKMMSFVRLAMPHAHQAILNFGVSIYKFACDIFLINWPVSFLIHFLD